MGRSFNLFWTSMSVSVLGSELTTFAIPIIAAVSLGATAQQMGLLVACSQIPNIFVSILAGPAIDRSAMRSLLAVLDFGRSILLALIAVLAFTGYLSIPTLAVIAFLIGCANSAFDTAYVGFTPYLVSQDSLYQANSRVEASNSTAQVVGPSLGGALVGSAGPAFSALSAAVAFLSAALLVLRIGESGSADKADDLTRESVSVLQYRNLVSSGLKFVWRSPALRLIVISSGSFNLFSGASASILTLFILRELGLTPTLFGIAAGIGSIGGLIGAALTPFLVGRLGAPLVIGLSLLTAALGELIVVWSPRSASGASIFVTISTFTAVSGITIFIVANIAIRQQVIPRSRIASVYGSMRFFTRGLLPIGALCSGLLVSLFGLRGGLIAIGVGQVLVALYCLAKRRKLDISVTSNGF
ncbi:MFS transporter [Corynebacterium atrinae]|uniref:MFS transporter n=1 Tax=Corynebacterium atrinae TaxID=1336740 RepID=UPI0025B6263B|nr:MFS transporter [Corynebacterium atrinae]